MSGLKRNTAAPDPPESPETTRVKLNSDEAKELARVHVIERVVTQVSEYAIEAAFKGHGSMKHVWVVDEDVDIYDPISVEWAMATRFQASIDMLVNERQPGSSLDPSGFHEEGKKTQVDKVGFDCTKRSDIDPGKYVKVQYGEVDVDDYIR